MDAQEIQELMENTNWDGVTPLADPETFDEDWHIAYPDFDVSEWQIADHVRYLVEQLEKNGLYDLEEEVHVFPNGYSLFTCTNWANLTTRYFGADRTVVKGYLDADNPGSVISNSYGGHDFAIVDDRYIVDGWVTGVSLEVEGRATPGLYDLQNEADAAEIARLYGDPATWELSGVSYVEEGVKLSA